MPGGGDGPQNMTTGHKSHFGSHIHHHHILAIENGVEFVRRNQHRMHVGSPDFGSRSLYSLHARGSDSPIHAVTPRRRFTLSCLHQDTEVAVNGGGKRLEIVAAL